MQIEGKFDEITWTPPVDAASLAHAWVDDSLTFVAKCVHDVILYAKNSEHFPEKGYWDVQLIIDSLYAWQGSNCIDDV